MHHFVVVMMVMLAIAGTATAANRIEFTIDIAGGKWQVTSDASTTLFNWRDAVEYNAYIGHSHSAWFTNVYRADYPKGFGKVLSFLSNTAQNGQPLPAGCNRAEIWSQSFDYSYPAPETGGSTLKLCWEDSLREKPIADDGSGSGGYSTPPAYTSPILMDLDDNGFELCGLSESVVFDINADGQPDRISWTATSGGDAFLVWDRSGNGVIDDGRELFGTATPLASGAAAGNGYLALEELDRVEHGGNADGVISSRDAVWRNLQVWTDANHDGRSQPAELRQLETAGVSSIDTRYIQSNRHDQYGNLFRYMSKAQVVSKHGRQHSSNTYDVFFAAGYK